MLEIQPTQQDTGTNHKYDYAAGQAIMNESITAQIIRDFRDSCGRMRDLLEQGLLVDTLPALEKWKVEVRIFFAE